jgi:hypothetical protein
MSPDFPAQRSALPIGNRAASFIPMYLRDRPPFALNILIWVQLNWIPVFLQGSRTPQFNYGVVHLSSREDGSLMVLQASKTLGPAQSAIPLALIWKA